MNAVCVRVLWLGRGWLCPPASSNRLSISGAGIVAAASPTWGGSTHCKSVATASSTGPTAGCDCPEPWPGCCQLQEGRHRAIGPSCHRAIMPSCHPGPCLFDNLNEDFLGKESIFNVAFFGSSTLTPTTLSIPLSGLRESFWFV